MDILIGYLFASCLCYMLYCCNIIFMMFVCIQTLEMQVRHGVTELRILKKKKITLVSSNVFLGNIVILLHQYNVNCYIQDMLKYCLEKT